MAKFACGTAQFREQVKQDQGTQHDADEIRHVVDINRPILAQQTHSLWMKARSQLDSQEYSGVFYGENGIEHTGDLLSQHIVDSYYLRS